MNDFIERLKLYNSIFYKRGDEEEAKKETTEFSKFSDAELNAFLEKHNRAIKARYIELHNEVKTKFACAGIDISEWKVDEKTFDRPNVMTSLMCLEMLSIMLDDEKTAADFREQVNEREGTCIVTFPLYDSKDKNYYKFGMLIEKGKIMTEEETMQTKFLKKLGII